ncbi:hypothetical protein AB0H00_27525 [Nocardia sp. NPDC023852]|uniref:hypothetical protein n=1 Tax=Nocardia sp. NPDC023852 TaxID=3154697 RepID=UPI0033F484B3
MEATGATTVGATPIAGGVLPPEATALGGGVAPAGAAALTRLATIRPAVGFSAALESTAL